MKFLIATALIASLVPAVALETKPAGYDPRVSNERPARDGCVNVPGVAHNSADCSTIPPQDYSQVRNTPSTVATGRPSGATENHERNIRIMSGRSAN